jgi:predicted Zn-dependent peptidase
MDASGISDERVAKAAAAGRQARPLDHSAHRITTLDAGVRVVTERVPGVRSVALGFWIGVGSAYEQPEQAGISHLVEHMLFRGTERFASQEIDQIFDAMGAEVNAGTDKEATSLYTRVLDRHLERAFDVMADMIWRPRFGELDAERQVVLEEIAMYEDDPQDKVFDVLGEAIFGEHPLGRAVIGRAEVIRALQREQLFDFHAQRYMPRNIVIAAAGSIEHDALVQMVRAVAPAVSAGDVNAADGGAARSVAAPAAAVPDAPHTAAPAFARRVRFLAKDTEQCHFCLGGRGISRHDEQRWALRVLEGVLGGTSSSRLFQEVRERRGLAYSIFSFSGQHKHTGEVGLYVGTRPENLREALDTIAAELSRITREAISDEELTRSRENLKGRMVLALESTGARMNRLGGCLLNDVPILSVDEVIDRIDAVQTEDVLALAGELFAPERLSVACVGADEDVFRDAVGALEQVAA